MPNSWSIVDTVLIKVASRCNLNCSYCYVYHFADDGWRSQPGVMPKLVQQTIVRQLAELYNYQNQPFSVVLHGGEPLLLGARRLRELCAHLRSNLPASCDIHIQTNGVLLTDEIIDLIVQHNVGISISYDGPEAVHDQFRVDLKGAGSHTKVSNAIDRLNNRADARSLFTGVLAVVDPLSDPHSVYYSLKATGSPKIDFLVRDGNYDELPYMKSSVCSTEYGCWLAKLLDIYLSDPELPRIRVFGDTFRPILGASAQKEGIGTADYGILVIETDGQINKNDTFKAVYRIADHFENNR